MKDNRVTRQPLMECVERTRKVAESIKAGDYAGAMELRGRGFVSALRTLRTIVRALPHPPVAGQKRFRFAFMHAGGPAPGMNTAVRAGGAPDRSTAATTCSACATASAAWSTATSSRWAG